MIIDFHTHIFPDALAARAMSALQNNCHGEYKPVHDLTLKGLIAAMDRFGVDKSVVMPVSSWTAAPAARMPGARPGWFCFFVMDGRLPFRSGCIRSIKSAEKFAKRQRMRARNRRNTL